MHTLKEEEVRSRYGYLTGQLIRKNFSIATMESMTGGLIASLITDTEGSSEIMKGAFVTYSNEAKIRLGVPAEVIKKYSVYSKQTAAAMAEACRSFYDADIGVGVTGTSGNIDPENPAGEPLKAYIAIARKGKKTATEAVDLSEYKLESRSTHKVIVAIRVRAMLLGLLAAKKKKKKERRVAANISVEIDNGLVYIRNDGSPGIEYKADDKENIKAVICDYIDSMPEFNHM